MRKYLAIKLLNEKSDEHTIQTTFKFMGHSSNIHKKVYQQSLFQNITSVSKRLDNSVGIKRTRAPLIETNDEFNTMESGEINLYFSLYLI